LPWTYETVRLSAENRRQIYIPAGFAHGYVVLSDEAEFLYKCSQFYFPEGDRGVVWDDPDLAIDWGITDPILSAKDRRLPRLSEIPEAELPRF
jgi:dTDP-4-dehydrorhamnose 3,5-epimerase